MAKLKGPLFSLSASGKLADALVYGDWKGIDYVRQYVTPSNPNSAGQQTQRGYITSAVAQWHDTSDVINAQDLINLNYAASLSTKPLSGFNYYVKGHVNTNVAGVTPVQLFGTAPGTPSGGNMQIVAHTGVSVATVKMLYGTTPRALVNELTRTEAATPGTTHTFDLSSLTAGVTYYYKILQSDANAKHDLGIGSFVAA